MNKGLKYWEEPKRYCSQTNNAIEKTRKDAVNEMLDRIEKEKGINISAYKNKGYLGSCNVESIYIGMDCRGDIEKNGNPEWQGIDCDPAGFMFEHINWTKYDGIYQTGAAMDNEYIYSLKKMLEKMGYKTEISKEPGPSFFKKHLPKNHPVLLNIPGHYVCGIAWDYLNGELIYHNPWPGDPRNKNNGRHERIKVIEWLDIPIRYGLAFWY